MQEGRQINQTVSFLPEASFAPALEDINVYTLDARILHVTNPALLPPPRHSYQSLADSHYRIHIGGLPVISGFVGESLTAGRFLFPSENVVEDRNTYDTYFNGGITPVLHLGSNSITFNGGLQFTIRRDTISPQYMSQNLFRQFLYVSTSSFYNWLSFTGSAIREAGPFTDTNLNSRDASAGIEFTVGRPWGHTSLITGYTARDLLFNPLVRSTSTPPATSDYKKVRRPDYGGDPGGGFAFLAGPGYASMRSAQAFLPGGRFEVRANPRWNVQGSFLLSRGEGYHEYDNAQSEFTGLLYTSSPQLFQEMAVAELPRRIHFEFLWACSNRLSTVSREDPRAPSCRSCTSLCSRFRQSPEWHQQQKAMRLSHLSMRMPPGLQQQPRG